MLWLALYFPDLPLELFSRGQPDEQPLAISQREGGRELIARCNASAVAQGVRPGLPLPAALALCENLQIRARHRRAEAQLLQELAEWAYQFSPQISFEPSLLLLEIGASLRLFGGQAALLDRLKAGLPALGLRSQWASAPTPMAAGLLARNRPGVQATQAQLRDLLAQIPLRALTRDTWLRRLIADIGLHSIGDCLQLPRSALARRAGPQLLHWFDRLLGDAPDSRRYWTPPQVFQQRLELLAELHDQQALLFPARRLVHALCGYLRGRDQGAQRLQWCLLHREQAPSCFEQGLLRPSRDEAGMLELLRERLERVSLVAPVIGLQLRVDDAQPFQQENTSWLSEQAPSQDTQLLERLRNRLGEQRVLGVCAAPDYRPEHAWRFCPPGTPGELVERRTQQPPWLLREPLALQSVGQQPAYGGPLALQGRARRIECGWWDGQDVARDYFVAAAQTGERLWVFRDRRSGKWFLHGLFS